MYCTYNVKLRRVLTIIFAVEKQYILNTQHVCSLSYPACNAHKPYCHLHGCWWVTSSIRKETSYSDRRFWVSYILFIIIIGGILTLYIYIYTYIYIYVTRPASKLIFFPSYKIHREVCRTKDLSATLYFGQFSLGSIVHRLWTEACNFRNVLYFFEYWWY